MARAGMRWTCDSVWGQASWAQTFQQDRGVGAGGARPRLTKLEPKLVYCSRGRWRWRRQGGRNRDERAGPDLQRIHRKNLGPRCSRA